MKWFVVIASVAWGTGLALEFLDPQNLNAPFFLKAFGGVFMSAALLRASYLLVPRLQLARLLALYYFFQVAFMAIISVEAPGAGFDNGFFHLTIRDHIDRVLFAHIAVQAGALLAALLFRVSPILQQHTVGTSLFESIHAAPPKLAYYFASIAAIRLLSPLANAEAFGGLVDYFIRTLSSMFAFVPLFVPSLHPRHWVVRRMWYMSIALTVLMGVFTGGRFSTFLPLVLLAVGLVLAAPTKRRKRVLGLSLAVSVLPFLLFMNFLGAVRDAEGRVTVLEVDSRRVETYISEATADDPSTSSSGQQQTALLRLINWPNLFAVVLSPDLVPFRSAENLATEVNYLVNIGLLSGADRSSLNRNELGTYPAKRFGFTVNDRTSVEYGLLADGWARGGLGVLLPYAFFLTFFLLSIETLCGGRISRLLPAESIVVIIVLFEVTMFDSASKPFFSALRSVVLNVPFVLLFCLILSAIYMAGRLRIGGVRLTVRSNAVTNAQRGRP